MDKKKISDFLKNGLFPDEPEMVELWRSGCGWSLICVVFGIIATIVYNV